MPDPLGTRVTVRVNKNIQNGQNGSLFRPRVSHFTSRWTTGWAWRKLKADNRCTWQQLNSLYSYSSSSLMFFVTLAVVLIRCQLLVTSKFTWWFRGSTDSHGASEKKRCTWTRAATCSESPPSFEWEAMRSNKSPPLQHSMTRDTTSSSWKTYTLKGRGMKRRQVENLGVSHNKISCCQSSSVYTNN